MADGVTFDLGEPQRAVARKAAGRGLCPECFGRVLGRWGHGLSNPERAARLAAELDVTATADPVGCPVCGGLFAKVDLWADRAVRAANGYEYRRFTCGSRWDP
ncbi:MAG TPA: hypothetical protein VEE86_00735, partial [Thermoplasmata archaeon]|nr:hypothetical protein [Thermoplasmata archaeon]